MRVPEETLEKYFYCSHFFVFKSFHLSDERISDKINFTKLVLPWNQNCILHRDV